ncbi:acidic mammalian chitinase isoform X2 [Cephus cinctus]|uniref:chitinase n=1 Tax=Cephus cinctus TaxID=211228 RepID=A0AAJ7BFX3_CEPCN|nr:acidic mammalian chitinase isoform X2 [Cephus cinctus]
MYFIVNIALVSLLLSTAVGHVILCYYGSWAVYRPGNGLFDPEHMDPTICTHIIYAFIGVSANGWITIFDPWADLPEGGGKDGFRKFVGLKEISPSTKVMISIGGWNHGSTTFSPMVTDPTTRATFVKNVVTFLKTYNFDGLDVNWEYPAQRGGISTDVENYVYLLQELKEAFEDDGYILTASVGAVESIASQSYDIPKVSKYVDFISLMTYDLNGSWNRVVGINAPLYPASHETTAAQLQLNAEACVTYWLNNGADPKKIVLGIPLYGRTFTLANPENNTPGSTANGPGIAGPYTREAGFIGYNELCEKNLTEKWTTVWFEEQKVPYAYYGNQWIGYDNEQSISIKSKYIIARELAGVMFWSAETDDFRAICHDTKFPLIKTAYNIFMTTRMQSMKITGRTKTVKMTRSIIIAVNTMIQI